MERVLDTGRPLSFSWPLHEGSPCAAPRSFPHAVVGGGDRLPLHASVPPGGKTQAEQVPGNHSDDPWRSPGPRRATPGSGIDWDSLSPFRGLGGPKSPCLGINLFTPKGPNSSSASHHLPSKTSFCWVTFGAPSPRWDPAAFATWQDRNSGNLAIPIKIAGERCGGNCVRKLKQLLISVKRKVRSGQSEAGCLDKPATKREIRMERSNADYGWRGVGPHTRAGAPV